MSSRTLLPTLSTQGWINRPLSVYDTMLSDFFLSEYSQTFVFIDDVSSFPWILQQFRGDIERISAETKSRLSIYFARQFNDVEVTVTYQANENSINSYALVLFMEFTDSEGETFNLSRLVKHDDLKVTEIISTLTNG